MQPEMFCRFASAFDLSNPVLGVDWAENYSCTYASGIFGRNAVSLTDASSSVTATYSIPEPFTVELWFRAAGSGRIFTNKYTGAQNLIYIRDGWVYVGNNAGDYVAVEVSWATAEWVHIAITYDGSDVRVYHNGSIVGTALALASPLNLLSSLALGDIDASNEGAIELVSTIKVFNYVKSTFNDRFNERAGMNDFVGVT